MLRRKTTGQKMEIHIENFRFRDIESWLFTFVRGIRTFLGTGNPLEAA